MALNVHNHTLGGLYYFPIADEETEAQGSPGTGPKSHTQEVVEPEFKFQSLCSEPLVISSPVFFSQGYAEARGGAGVFQVHTASKRLEPGPTQLAPEPELSLHQSASL